MLLISWACNSSVGPFSIDGLRHLVPVKGVWSMQWFTFWIYLWQISPHRCHQSCELAPPLPSTIFLSDGRFVASSKTSLVISWWKTLLRAFLFSALKGSRPKFWILESFRLDIKLMLVFSPSSTKVKVIKINALCNSSRGWRRLACITSRLRK